MHNPLPEISALRSVSESFRSRRLHPLIWGRVERDRARLADAAADRYTSILYGEYKDSPEAAAYRARVRDIYLHDPIGEESAARVVRERIEPVLAAFPITGHLSTGASYDDVKAWAEDQSYMCLRSGSDHIAVEMAKDCFGEHVNVTPARTHDPIWWRRTARKHLRRAREALWRAIAPLNFIKGVSPEMWADSFEQDEKNQQYMEKLVAVGPAGQRVKMSSPAKQSAKKYAELMLRANAMAQRNTDKTALFVTVTVPEKWHPTTTKSGKREENPGYDFSVGPRESQAWLNKRWRRMRATKLWGRLSPDFIRAAEPHGDGTPHWHILMWVPEEDVSDIIEMFRAYFIEEDASEARKAHGLKIDTMKDGRHALGYLAKYVGKQVKQEKIEKQEKASDSNPVAWRRAHGVRSFATSAKRATLWRLAFNGRFDHTADIYLSVMASFVKERDVANFEEMSKVFDLVYEVRMNRYGEPVERLAGVVNILTGEVTMLERWQVELDAVGPPSDQDEGVLLVA